jgi:hypothetical protein
MTKLLIAITERLIDILRTKGVDIRKLKPIKEEDQTHRSLESNLYLKQGDLSMLRAEIIMLQNDLIKTIRDPVMEVLHKMEDTEDRTNLIMSWARQLKYINAKVDEHLRLIKEFEDAYNKLTEFENKTKQ